MRMRKLGPVAALLWAVPAFGQGLLIPTEPTLPPLAIRSHKVTVDIDKQTSVTKVEQVFENNTQRPLEARFLFPIPRGAVMTKFTMLVDGKEKAGELVERKQAREIYNSIVMRAQDPGLLEWLGHDLFRANIFPIAAGGTQTVTVSFSQVLPQEGELVGYSYPLRTSDKRGPVVRNDFSLNVNIKSEAPIRNVYSPTHSILVSRPDEKSAQVGFEQQQAALDKDFQLFYSVSDKDVGLNLVAHRPDKDKPGYFLMLISPRSKALAEKLIKRDIVFVLDNSGSMAGEKIAQAREALKYCIKNLNVGDRFNIVKFSTDVEPWKNQLVDAAEFRDDAMKFADLIEAEGGTNIDGALRTALSFKKDPSRPYIVVFMTDGKPTLGETTDPKQILKNVDTDLAKDMGRQVRIFTWGVGYDVDTHLLDRIAESASGVSEYVKPKEDIAVKVASFYNKASRPVLTDVKFEVVSKDIQIVDIYPKKMPDLYAGTQLVVFGRYTGKGSTALKLTGSVNNTGEKFVYECDFSELQSKNGFIEPLWAKRRIGHLLDTIRLHGETKEVVDDVIRLSKEYGIQTPYTSYLVLEDGMTVPANPGNGGPVAINRPRPGIWRGERQGGAAGAPAADEAKLGALEKRLDGLSDDKQKTAAAKPEDPNAAKARDLHNAEADALAKGFGEKAGKEAVDVAGYLKRLKEADTVSTTGAAFKKAGGTRFYQYRGLWVDERFEAVFAVTQVKFGSDAYFAIIDKKPELTEVFKIGASLVYVTATGKALVIASTGLETLGEPQIAELFVAAAK